MDPYELARTRAQNIRNGITDADVDTADQLDTAYRSKDWDAQGYDDWVTYVEAEFDFADLHENKLPAVHVTLTKTVNDALVVAHVLGLTIPQATSQKELKRMARKKLGVYQVARPLTSEELKALEASIKEHGRILEPIVVDDEGNILDGHHRKHIGDKLGIEVPTRVMSGLDEDQKLAVAKELNFNRRHLNSDEKRQLIIDELTANPKLANRAIARLIGASEGTVRNIRKELEAAAQITQTDTAVGKDGVERKKPAAKEKPEEPTFSDIEQVEPDDDDEDSDDDDTPTGVLSALGELAEAVRRIDKAAQYLGDGEADRLGLTALKEKLDSISEAIEYPPS